MPESETESEIEGETESEIEGEPEGETEYHRVAAVSGVA